MDKWFDEATKIGQDKHPRNIDKTLQYGTAGFRTKAVELDHVLYRIGLLATLRSKDKRGATIGVMITASHNPEEDNGVKLIDPQGEMLEASWEKHAANLANVPDSSIAHTLHAIVSAAGIDVSQTASVVFARDTRPSSSSLAEALMDGLDALHTPYKDYGLLATPQLHYMVKCVNTSGAYGEPTEAGYYSKLSIAFNKLAEKFPARGQYSPTVYIDSANGVGGPKMELINPHINSNLTVQMVQSGENNKLNFKCGADYVKIQQICPAGVTLESGVQGVSFDGDADRIVFYYNDSDGLFHLLDGDKIATLIAGFLKELMTLSGIELDFGLVQTAYANGSSTKYITDSLKVPVACVPTGVKHLHHRAQQMDIGVYFEANGHGTVLFSDRALEKIRAASDKQSLSTEEREAASTLLTVVDLINQTVGDAISDLLLVETILRYNGWSIEDWNESYTDLPNRQLKVTVTDRTAIQTTDAERKTVTPPGLQDAIDQIVSHYKEGRSFVRPSGTEDIVRVYAEASTRQEADLLANQVSVLVYDKAGGVDDRPKPV